MGKYRVNFKRPGTAGDIREYGIIVEAETLGAAEEKALQDIRMTHAKAFLNAQSIIKIEQIS